MNTLTLKDHVNWMNASDQKKVLIHAFSLFECINERENCEAIFGFSDRHYMVVTEDSVMVGDNKMSLIVPTKEVKSIFNISKQIRKDVDKIGFNLDEFNKLKIHVESKKSALFKRHSWIYDHIDWSKAEVKR